MTNSTKSGSPSTSRSASRTGPKNFDIVPFEAVKGHWTKKASERAFYTPGNMALLSLVYVGLSWDFRLGKLSLTLRPSLLSTIDLRTPTFQQISDLSSPAFSSLHYKDDGN